MASLAQFGLKNTSWAFSLPVPDAGVAAALKRIRRLSRKCASLLWPLLFSANCRPGGTPLRLGRRVPSQ